MRLCPPYDISITPRADDGVHLAVAENVRSEIRRAEDFGEGDIANAEATGVGADGRHHRALAIGGKAPALGGPASGGDAVSRVQEAGDLPEGTRRFMAE